MPKDTTYSALVPDSNGRYVYSAADTTTWGKLFRRQMSHLPGKVAPAYLKGVKALGLTADSVPQVVDIDRRLNALSGAGVVGVPAIIPPTQFFTLLARRNFPVATFLRRPEHLDYIEEPDLFHEVFGHCPLLTNNAYADFIARFGQLALEMTKEQRWYMFRLFWFTVEFGLIRDDGAIKAFGAGIVSSPAELTHVFSGAPVVRDFEIGDVLRTPYRIDIVQPVYFAIDSFEQLAGCLETDLNAAIKQAQDDGDHSPLFQAE